MEMNLRASLIKQMEATQQAERKSMNKTLAFASASHDIRNTLVAIDASVDLSQNVRSYNSKFADSVLDMSKIESGKMHLEEEEFEVAQLVEDAVDLYHPIGMKKGVDVVFDVCDGSILKFSQVKGDKGKLSQILNNLLGNALKFTSQGHVTVRAWARKPKTTADQLMAESKNLNSLKCLWCHYMFRNNSNNDDIESVNASDRKNLMEFIFEVDDTGKGIPKEKHKSVSKISFRLKIRLMVSEVRLMGGEIGIKDKEIGNAGTCFRFNIYLPVPETSVNDFIESGEESTSSCRLNFLQRKAYNEASSNVVILMENGERRRVLQKFLESLEINISVVTDWEKLPSTVRKLKSKWHYAIGSPSSGKLEIGRSPSETSSSRSRDVPLSTMDGIDQKILFYRRRGGLSSFLILIIDISVGPQLQLQRIVTDFLSGLQTNSYTVVWLNNSKPNSHEVIELEKFNPRDDVLLKPLHGLRLYHHVIKHLPEFGGVESRETPSKSEQKENIRDNSSSSSGKITQRPGKQILYQGEIEEINNNSSYEESSWNKVLHFSPMKTPSRSESLLGGQSDKPFAGKRILVAEDDIVIAKLAERKISQLGANVELCGNGEESILQSSPGSKAI
ncbi:histidine kinase CKI1-like [Rutidosis leptorrhynchoides]|uniref:histidine kinase CKI1-like n=1 Tax=Rutidosis leptorrhynchoides TaxID=125765 RepID=UPI003A99EAFE